MTPRRGRAPELSGRFDPRSQLASSSRFPGIVDRSPTKKRTVLDFEEKGHRFLDFVEQEATFSVWFSIDDYA